MSEDTAQIPLWESGKHDLTWDGRRLETKYPLRAACLLPDSSGMAFAVQFDENTSPDESNVFIVRRGEKAKAITVRDDDERLVRILGCYSMNGMLVLNAANSFEYWLDPKTLLLQEKRYYR